MALDRINRRFDEAQVKVDAARARSSAMLIQPSPELRIEDLPLLNFNVDPKELLEEYLAAEAAFSTVPFDPGGHQLKLFPGNVTVWSGYPGAGKTTILRQLICHQLYQNKTVFVASLEEDPRKLIVRLAGTACGMKVPDVSRLTWFVDLYADRLRIWGKLGLAKHRAILGTIQALKCDHAVIDSLMCLDIANDNWDGQRVFMNALEAVAHSTGTHCHLVAHPHKPMSNQQEPDVNIVAGAREIGAVADNVIFIKRSNQESASTQRLGMMACILKQRNGEGGTGQIQGWYQRAWRQFSNSEYPLGRERYLPKEAFEDWEEPYET